MLHSPLSLHFAHLDSSIALSVSRLYAHSKNFDMDLTLDYNTVPLPADPGLSMACYTAEPGSPSAERLALLASWAATPHPAARGSADRDASSHGAP